MQLEPVTVLAGCQLLLDVVLLAAIVFMYRRLKTLDPENLGAMLHALRHGEKLCKELDQSLRTQGKLVQDISRQLQTPQDTRRHGSRDSEHSRGLLIARPRILALWKQGKSVAEIAAATEVPQGEVEIIISLARSSALENP